jgi:hypothetical protein
VLHWWFHHSPCCSYHCVVPYKNSWYKVLASMIPFQILSEDGVATAIWNSDFICSHLCHLMPIRACSLLYALCWLSSFWVVLCMDHLPRIYDSPRTCDACWNIIYWDILCSLYTVMILSSIFPVAGKF